MTEKRFEIMVGGTAWDNLQDKELTYDENIDLLNKLFDENEQLKQQINDLIKGIQDSAQLSADAICKTMQKERWGDVE